MGRLDSACAVRAFAAAVAVHCNIQVPLLRVNEGETVKGIDGKVAIVTGGASGIGAGVARAFIAAGANVVIGDLLETEGRALEAELGSQCRFVATDLRRDEDIGRLVDAATQTFGGLDFIICVACTYADRGAESSRSEWMNGFDVNLFGHLLLVQQARPWLARSTCASVVNFSSGSANFALSGRWIYPATKAAIEQVTRSQAMDLAADGIRVNAVQPAWTAKASLESGPAEARERYHSLANRLHMLGRAGRAGEVADAVLFLCSEHAGFVTGSCLRVDGGHTAMGPQGRDRVLPTDLRAAGGRA
jgi:NAD(P)-dependent dehydrogenase (short-subunit alcohol dehydrogenase family)